MSDSTTAKVENGSPVTIESSVQLAKRAFALGKTEEAVSFYATALELTTEKHGEDAPEYADLLFAYGKALLENAIAQSAVLAKEEAAAEEPEPGPDASGSKASRFHFGGDEEEEGESGDKVVEFKNEPIPEEEDEDDDDDEGDQEDGAPEDDFNAAWEVLDLARAFYEKKDDEESRLKLADSYVALGDVSLETEKFEQAIEDYAMALKLKQQLLPLHNRQIAEAHWKLSMVLDLTSGRLGDAVTHVESAIASITARLNVLRDGVQGSLQTPAADDSKGKGKANTTGIQAGDPLAALSKDEMTAEIKEIEDLKAELELKLEDLRSSPETLEASAPDLAAQQLTKELNASGSGSGSGSSLAAGPVNDLSGMVKKKKKPVPATELESNGTVTGKRKAEEEDSNPEKKIKVDQGA